MDPKSLGKNIEALRKKCKMTQCDLAAKIGVSDKAVSRWERGAGYPDITVLPLISNLFGVSVDHLLMGERKGITIAGNIIADVVKSIDVYPEIGMLTNVSSVTLAVGGCAPNTSINLSKIDSTIPINVIGKVGNDSQGRYIISELQKNNIGTSDISFSSESETSFCDVMSMPTGERTFFHKKGANADFSYEDINIENLNCKIFHIGYILLLDKFDAPDEKYGTVMARLLHDIQKTGVKTSFDVVSSSSADFGSKVLPALKYTDYAFMNEIEACSVFDLSAYRSDNTLNTDNILFSMKEMAKCGVSEKIIVHSKTVSFILDIKSECITTVPSLKIPPELIKGSVGAGDAFCAGCLCGLYHQFPDKKILEFASAAAACNLFAENSVDGMRSKEEIEKICNEFERITL